MIEFRYADEISDNEALISILQRCVQGTDFQIIYDPSPDFFNRSRQYQDNRTLVAIEDDEIVGVTSVAFLNKRVCGEMHPVAYTYGLNVCPNHRRKGIASKLKTRIEEIIDEEGSDLIYNTILKANIPSIKLQEKFGFHLVRDMTNYTLTPYKPMKTNPDHVRVAEEKDLEEIAYLTNKTHEDFDLYQPVSPNGYQELLTKNPFYDISNILVYEEAGEVKSFLGYVESDQMQKTIIVNYTNKLKLLKLGCSILGHFMNAPIFPNVGDHFRELLVKDYGCESPEFLKPLLNSLNNLAVKEKKHCIHIMGAEPPISNVLKDFFAANTDMQIYGKPLNNNVFSGLGNNRICFNL